MAPEQRGPASRTIPGVVSQSHRPRRTTVVAVDADVPDPNVIAEAAGVLRGGGLVAFPTETVYGLGANALETGGGAFNLCRERAGT